MIVQDEVSFVKVKNGSDGSAGENGKDGSNGKDGANGKDSNMHTAYSWSADGSDRFTDKYPNENLFTAKNARQEKTGTREFVNSADWDMAPIFNSLGLLEYTVSFDIKALKKGPVNVYSQNGLGTLYGIGTKQLQVTTEYQRMFTTFTPYKHNNSETRALLAFYGFYDSGVIPIVKNVKIEVSSKMTVDTPSPTNDFNNAWPTYSGTYSSHDKVQSQNPKDYTWARIRGADGSDGKDGQTPKDVISGYLSNEAIIVPATPTGNVTDYSKAFGDFIVSEGQTKLVNGVTYSKVTEANMTSTINSAGRYVVTALSADTGTATYRATYAGVTVDKILIVVKNKQGETGNNGVGVSSTVITYQVGNSGTTTPTGSWSSAIPSVAENQFLWTRTITTYTNNTTSTGYSVSKIGGTGNTGNGVKSSATAYVGSTSGTTIPTSGWTSSIPTVAEGSYLWTRTILTFTDNTTNTSYSVAKQGAQGNTGPKGDPTGITVSPTVPTNPYINMLWQNTGSNNGYLTGTVYQWNGAKWNIFIFSAENIVATTLSALSAYLGNVQGGSITGAEFINTGEFFNPSINKKCSFETSINGPISTNYSEKDGPGKGHFYLSPVQVGGSYSKTGNIEKEDHSWSLGDTGAWFVSGNQADGDFKYANFRLEGLRMFEERFNRGSGDFELTISDIAKYPPTQLDPAPGYSIYSVSGENLPTAKRSGRAVTLSGAFKNNSNVSTDDTEILLGRLPKWAVPKDVERTVCQGSGMNRFLLTVRPNGNIYWSRYGNSSSYGTAGAGAWLSINIRYDGVDL